jgi:selenocysteine-specific elongation factor
MIVTLAGHVDHGKTSLVRALTGVDTDRLEQEKQRGLTIDLGFAYLDDGRLGFVDVPGHHKFIHNMVAGVASHQYALMVIAADDGPMPQSREHLDILRLIGIEQGVIALTKTDRVAPERLEQCKQEIANLVDNTFLEGAPIIPTSTEDPATIERLLDHLRDQVDAEQRRDAETGFRLAIDRAFLVKGAGLVVTGTVHSGKVAVDDSLYHFPSGKNVRVRGIRAQDQVVKEACSGERCALNLSGIELDEVERGDWVSTEASPAYLEISGQLTVLESFPRPIKHWTPIHIYHATSHSTGRIALLDEHRLVPGETAAVDIVLDAPLAVRHGDQLIIRDYSLDVTLGGLRVIHAKTAVTSRRRNEQRRAMLEDLASDLHEEALQALLQRGPVDPDDFRQVRHLRTEQVQTLGKQLNALNVAGHLVSRDYWGGLAKHAFQQVRAHQLANPSSPGLRENEITGVPAELKQTLLNALVQAGQLKNTAGLFQLPDHTAELPEALAKAWRRLEPALDQTQAPSTGDLAKQWSVPQQQLESDLKELSKRGYVIHVANHRFYLPKQLENLAGQVKMLAADKPFSVREFRDRTGIGRNVAIEILEYFDRRGFTRRQDNERIVLKDSF